MTESTLPAAYTVAEADLVRDREGILRVWERCLPDKDLAPEKFDWYYRSNPLGPGRIFKLVADTTGEIVGTAGVGPRMLKVGAESFRIGINSDFAVDAGHRSLMPAVRLSKAVLGLIPNNFDLIYGLPNVNALPLLNRVGYKISCEIVRHARILRSAGYLARKSAVRPLAPALGPIVDFALSSRTRSSGSGIVKQLSGFDERFDALWQRARGRYKIATERTAEYLDWRYSRCPLRRFHVAALLEPSGKDLLGYAVYYMDGPHARLADLVADSESSERDTLLAAIKISRDSGAESISLLSGNGPLLGSALANLGFQRRGDDSSSRSVVTNLGPTAAEVWPEHCAGAWYILAGDEDFN